MTEWLLLGLSLLLVVACGVFVAAEFALVTVSRPQVERAVAESARGARGTQLALRSLSTQLSGAQVGITITNLAIGFLAEPSISQLLRPRLRDAGASESLATGIGWALALTIATFLTMLFGELVPKNLALAHPLGVARMVQGPQRAFTTATKPLTASLNAAANALVRRLGVEPQEELASTHSPQELVSLIEASAESGALGRGEAALVQGSLRLDDKLVREVFTPRTRMVSIASDGPVQDVLALARGGGHSRFPVTGTDVDDIVGIVGLDQAVAVPPAQRLTRRVGDICAPALTVPDTLPLDDLLWALRRRGTALAVVLDEYGGTAGVATFEDVVEEIVGNVHDEHDEVETPVITLGEADWSISGLLRPDELYDQTSVRLPVEQHGYETVAGFVMDRLGWVPRSGDRIEVEGLALEVERMDGRRVDRLRLTRTQGQQMGGHR